MPAAVILLLVALAVLVVVRVLQPEERPVIRLENLHVRVGAFDLRDISLEVPKGGYALIIGPTGSGKTTLLEAIAGHARLKAGRVFMHDEEVTDLPPERRGLGFVYQQYHLFPHLSVRDNIGYGIARGRARQNGVTPAARIAELAAMLAIEPLLDRPVRGLSGGEQQRVALARALAPRPSILLLDEPFAAVDPATRQVLRRELRELHEREGITTPSGHPRLRRGAAAGRPGRGVVRRPDSPEWHSGAGVSLPQLGVRCPIRGHRQRDRGSGGTQPNRPEARVRSGAASAAAPWCWMWWPSARGRPTRSSGRRISC